jgi:hypothetical protein
MRMDRNEKGHRAVAQDTVRWLFLLDTVMNLPVYFVWSFVCDVKHKYLLYEISNNELFKVKVNVRLSVHNQSVRLGAKPLEARDQRFLQLNPFGYSRSVTSPLTRCVCLMNMLAFCQVYVSDIYHVIENSCFFTIYGRSPLLVQALLSKSCLSYASYAKTVA